MECNMENVIKMVRGKKKFFLKSFLVSLVIFILSVVIVMTGYENWAQWAEKFYGISKDHYILSVVLLLGFWKILIIQFTLVPFIALFFAEKCLKAKEGQE